MRWKKLLIYTMVKLMNELCKQFYSLVSFVNKSFIHSSLLKSGTWWNISFVERIFYFIDKKNEKKKKWINMRLFLKQDLLNYSSHSLSAEESALVFSLFFGSFIKSNAIGLIYRALAVTMYTVFIFFWESMQEIGHSCLVFIGLICNLLKCIWCWTVINLPQLLGNLDFLGVVCELVPSRNWCW